MDVSVLYTPWSNLKKEQHMEIGEVNLITIIINFIEAVGWIS